MKIPMTHCVLSLSVYRQGDNPVFGETVTRVTLEDEAGGLFFILEQEDGKLRFDFDEFEEVVKAVKTLQQIAKGVENEQSVE